MNAKTYGQVLENELDKNGEHIFRISEIGNDCMEQVARAVILEFVRRVEEESLSRTRDLDTEARSASANAHLMAFDQLAHKLKEAK